MTQSLAGRVPTALLVPLIRQYLAEHETDLTSLERNAEIGEGQLSRWFSGEYETTEFDHADRLLCKMRMSDLWTLPPLRDIYYAVDLTLQQCAAAGCSVWFRPKTTGERAHIYCSKPCKNAAVKMRLGVTKRRFKRKGSNRCWRGHTLTPENTISFSGKRQCRTCFNAAQRARRARKRQAVAA